VTPPLPSLYGQGGVVVLPVTDPALLAHLPDASGETCRACESESSASTAEYIIWVHPRADRPYWAICSSCLDALGAFFRWRSQ
jgi:hypothetical protein